MTVQLSRKVATMELLDKYKKEKVIDVITNILKAIHLKKLIE